MLEAQKYFRAQSWAPVAGHVLTASEAQSLSKCLRIDGSALLASATISAVDAIRGLQLGFYSWPTAKLYYSVFYSFRAILAVNGFSVIYEGTKPRKLQARPGGVCTKASGTTHQVVVANFVEQFSNHWLLSQEIDLLSPPIWLMHLREQANYVRGHFWEPECPGHFERLKNAGLRKALDAYLGDRQLAFDPDHAALAYPLQALLEARSGASKLTEQDARFLKARARDTKGPLSELIRRVMG